MKKIKKLLAMLMAMTMVLGMGATVFATESDPTLEKNTDCARVLGIEAETNAQGTVTYPTVTVYQVVKFDPADRVYKPVDNATIKANVTTSNGQISVTAANASALASTLNTWKDNTKSAVLEQVTESGQIVYKSNTNNNNALDAGIWLVHVTGSTKFLYNPAIISVDQQYGTNGQGGLGYGTLNLANGWEPNTYLKKSEPGITKTVVSENAANVQYGDELEFKLVSHIPSYTPDRIKAPNTVKYTISDTLTGLTLVSATNDNVTAKIGGTDNEDLKTLVINAINAAITAKANTFTVDFENSQTLITGNLDKDIEITYKAKVSSSAQAAVDLINNKAELQYSTNGTTAQDVLTKMSETKHYTFGFGTNLNADNTTIKTDEFYKINEDGTITKTTGGTEVETVTGALKGAEFQLHIDTANGDLFTNSKGDTFTTDEYGRLEINGLDADVTYVLVETKAPTGYSLSNETITVKVNATYDGSGVLTGHNVVFTEANGTTHTSQYSYNAGSKTTTVTSIQPLGFKNTTLSQLPSTGGIGTTIFTIGGCALMIIAAGLYFATRRKTAK